MNFIDPDGLKPGDPYKTLDAAARAAIDDVFQQSIKEDSEYAGMLYQRPDGRFSYTKPNPGSAHKSRPGGPSVCPSDSDPAGFYHTHGKFSGFPYKDEIFYPTDIRLANRWGLTAYLKTPHGKWLKYNPSLYSRIKDLFD